MITEKVLKRFYVTSYNLGSHLPEVVSTPQDFGMDLEIVGRPHRWDYLHGKLEGIFAGLGGYDIPCFFGFCPDSEGVHKGFAFAKKEIIPVTYFLWKTPTKMRGLIVSDDDMESVEYAKELFDKKEFFYEGVR